MSFIEAAMGCMLAQMDDEGIERAVVYYLMLLRLRRRGLVTKKLRHYMLAYQVIIISRMDPLKYLFENPAGGMARWLIVLSYFV
uniref:Uncharacterized protein n=1 Tax=Utricularia reniformis TaxID=192314 RepID=A0A1Y0B4S4_9LAMI|nr:hypothetical protein AEK19_MT2239 [Utricularia reniformis]ART32384.1 hypothetical protein AEK19_MT2239 [Utricularia reniformis]